nr:MAG TPA: hypothetical protein [Caudoviricetes sp.]
MKLPIRLTVSFNFIIINIETKRKDCKLCFLLFFL